MSFGNDDRPDPPPIPRPPAPPPDPPIKPKDTKKPERVQRRAARRRGTQAARVTGGMGLTDDAPTTRKTLLGQ